jgi:hypothetical protein
LAQAAQAEAGEAERHARPTDNAIDEEKGSEATNRTSISGSTRRGS